jgi:hypothetical protein
MFSLLIEKTIPEKLAERLCGKYFLYNFYSLSNHSILRNMAKYSKGAGKKVEKVMREKKQGKLRSGSGAKVTSRKQAIAIALSEAREEGEKVPKKTASKGRSKTAPKGTRKSASRGRSKAASKGRSKSASKGRSSK